MSAHRFLLWEVVILCVYLSVACPVIPLLLQIEVSLLLQFFSIFLLVIKTDQQLQASIMPNQKPESFSHFFQCILTALCAYLKSVESTWSVADPLPEEGPIPTFLSAPPPTFT